MRSLFSLVGLIVSISMCFAAHAGEAVSPPRFVTTRGVDGFSYWLTRHLVFDLDEMLQQQGLDLPVCTFRQRNPNEEHSFRELGKCLMKDFFRAMKSDDDPGTVYTWIRDSRGLFHPVEIRWRPPMGGWSNIIGQILEMKFEKPLYWVREKIWGHEASEKVRFSEFILGSLEIILPDDPRALETLNVKGNTWVQNYLKRMKSVSVNMKTIGNEKGQVIYAGLAVMQMKTNDGEPNATKIQLKTNVNVSILKRPFFTQAQIQTQGADLLRMGAQP